MGRLYKREATLTIVRPAGDSFFDEGPNAIVVRGLRVGFKIEKNGKKDPNTCELVIYNLAPNTRAALQRLPLRVTVHAGYSGRLAQIFTGDLEWSESSHKGTDWETLLIVGDGSRARKHARVSRSFKKATKEGIIRELASTIGLSVPTNLSGAVDLKDQFVSGLTLQGPAYDELDRIVKSSGRQLSIQDGRLQILGPNELRPDQAIVISRDTGMIGSPSFGAPTKKGEAPEITIETILEPRLTPGGKIKLEARTVTGLFRAETVTHTGDTHAEAWTTTVEATPV